MLPAEEPERLAAKHTVVGVGVGDPLGLLLGGAGGDGRGPRDVNRRVLGEELVGRLAALGERGNPLSVQRRLRRLVPELGEETKGSLSGCLRLCLIWDSLGFWRTSVIYETPGTRVWVRACMLPH